MSRSYNDEDNIICMFIYQSTNQNINDVTLSILGLFSLAIKINGNSKHSFGNGK